MTESEIQRFNDSFARCMECPAFFDVFYDRFLSTSEEVREKFAHTEFKRQKKALKSSLYLTLIAIVRRQEDFSFLDPIAVRHSRAELDIRPELYVPWLDSLVFAVSKCDDRFDARIENVWRQAMQRAIDYVVARY